MTVIKLSAIAAGVIGGAMALSGATPASAATLAPALVKTGERAFVQQVDHDRWAGRRKGLRSSHSYGPSYGYRYGNRFSRSGPSLGFGLSVPGFSFGIGTPAPRTYSYGYSRPYGYGYGYGYPGYYGY